MHEGWDYQEILIKHCIKSCAPDDQKEIQTIHYVEANQEEIGLATNNVGLGLDAAIVEKPTNRHQKSLK